jgi:hypothetical protein
MKSKELTDSDLGLSPSSNQTHIGLHSSMLSSWTSSETIYDVYLFIEGQDNLVECKAVINAITRDSGAIEAPKIKVGSGIPEDKNLNKIIRRNAGTDRTLRVLSFAELDNRKILAFLTRKIPCAMSDIAREFSQQIGADSNETIKKFTGNLVTMFRKYSQKKGYEFN